MSEEREEGPIMTGGMDSSFEEREDAPTSIDATDNPDSIEVSVAEPQEEKVQEQNTEIEQVQEEPRISKGKQKRRITSYLSNISKQVEKQGNQINKLTMLIQSFQKQTKPISAGIGQPQFQSIKQIISQISQLQKQVTQVQKEMQKLRTAPIARSKSKSRSKFPYYDLNFLTRLNATSPYNVTQNAQILRVDLANPTKILPIAYVNQIEDKAAAHGDWESSGILDASKYFGDGSWLVDVQAHTIDEGGQLLLLKIPGS